MKIAYLINQYPKVSHSFIRREIQGIEACGISIERFSVRSCESELVDEADAQELEKTHFILQQGGLRLITAGLKTAISRPQRFFQALQLTFQASRYSERGLLRHLAYLAEACLLLQWFANLKITHVHAHFGTNSTTVAMLCQVLGGPTYSFTVHGPEEFDAVKGFALEEKINRAAFVVVVSSFGKSQLSRWCSRKQWSKIKVIHCGVDEAFLSQPFQPISEAPHLVCVGRLSEQKGHLLLLEAVRELAKEGLEFKLTLVGDGPLRAEIESLMQEWELQNYIQITGWASSLQVQNYILSARAVVLPSFAEGLPVVIMEALALSRPVISTYVAGIPELVKPGVCGWLVPAGSVETIAQTMRTVLKSTTEELELMGIAGAKQVAQQHNALKEASKLAKLFKEV